MPSTSYFSPVAVLSNSDQGGLRLHPIRRDLRLAVSVRICLGKLLIRVRGARQNDTIEGACYGKTCGTERRARGRCSQLPTFCRHNTHANKPSPSSELEVESFHKRASPHFGRRPLDSFPTRSASFSTPPRIGPSNERSCRFHLLPQAHDIMSAHRFVCQGANSADLIYLWHKSG